MLKKTFLAMAVAAAAGTLLFAASSIIGAAGAPGVALTGQISSQEEGFMEGVLVSAKRDGSALTTTVASDAKGRYNFPPSKLQPGRYALHIRAVGYELEGTNLAEGAGQKT